jgi:hypothetical protein
MGRGLAAAVLVSATQKAGARRIHLCDAIDCDGIEDCGIGKAIAAQFEFNFPRGLKPGFI